MGPYDPIPEVSPAAGDSVNELYNSINRTFPGAVTNFEARWKAWNETWFSDKFSSKYVGPHQLTSNVNLTGTYFGNQCCNQL